MNTNTVNWGLDSDMSDFLFKTIAELAAAIRAKEVSATELVEAHLRQIERVNPSLNAVVQLCAERALDEAVSADNTPPILPLHGIPITLKDSIDTADIITTYGTWGRRNFIPTHDATVAKRLRDAGAIVLGKTNTPEFTFGGECDNPVYGKTYNPYKLTHSPGSSSGGAAAIVAAGGATFDLGSDTGGSIREPANYCGLAGIKPTAGRISRTGHAVPFGVGAADMLTTIGPIARSVADLELVLRLIAGPDGVDYTVVPQPLPESAAALPAQLRIAIYTDGGVGDIDPAVESTLHDVANALANAGATIISDTPPLLTEAMMIHGWLIGIDGAEWVARLIDKAGTEVVGDNLKRMLFSHYEAERPTVNTILTRLAELRAQAWAWFQSYDAILCPVNPQPAIPHGQTLTWGAAKSEGWSHLMYYNLTGYPAGTVRAGTSADGLPIGVQIVAHPWREDLVFTILRQIESAFGGYHPPAWCAKA